MLGAEHLFIVWMDHKNLDYVRSVKRLPFRQAHRTLFFNRFRFTLTFCLGSRNVIPDVLSPQFSPDESSNEPKGILPCILPPYMVATRLGGGVPGPACPSPAA